MTFTRYFPRLPFTLLMAASLVAPLAADDAAGTRTDYRIGAKDLLEIKVIELPELSVERRVSDDGRIDLPLIGEFEVSGLSASEAGKRLSERLTREYVNRANVSIVVKEAGSKPLSILGAVANPGSLSVSGRYSLLQAISAAGGLTAQAGRKIYVIRTNAKGESRTIEIRTDDLLRSANSQHNIVLYPSDVVNIPPKSNVKIYCLGEVNAPGALVFDSDDRLSLLAAIAQAGGLTDRAARNITITRRGPNGKDQEVTVDYKDVINGRTKDPELQPDDVVIVKQSFF